MALPVSEGPSTVTGSPTTIIGLELGRSCFPRKRRKKGVWMTNTNGYRCTVKCKHIPRSPVITVISCSYQHLCCTYYINVISVLGLGYHKDEWGKIFAFRVQVVDG